jgi:hypothetical protein
MKKSLHGYRIKIGSHTNCRLCFVGFQMLSQYQPNTMLIVNEYGQKKTPAEMEVYIDLDMFQLNGSTQPYTWHPLKPRYVLRHGVL